MDYSTVMSLIAQRIREIAATKRVDATAIVADTPLFDGVLPIDSLDLAALIVELEMTTRSEPFRDGLIEFHTVGELAALFAANA